MQVVAVEVAAATDASRKAIIELRTQRAKRRPISLTACIIFFLAALRLLPLLYKNRLRRDGRAPWSRRGRAVRAARVFYTAPFCWGGWPGRLELVGMVRAAGVPIRRGRPPDAVPRPVRQGPLKKPGLLKKGQRLPLVVIGRL